MTDIDVRGLLRAIGRGEGLDRVGDGASLLEAGILDSLAMMELIEGLEKRHGFRVAEDEMTPENFDSVDAITAFVRGKLGGA